MALSGKSSREGAQEQQCPQCGRWFPPDGFDSHERNCSVKETPYVRFDKERDKLVKRKCGECGVLLRWDESIEEQGERHNQLCPRHPDSIL